MEKSVEYSGWVELRFRRRKAWKRIWMVLRPRLGLSFYKNSKEYELERQISSNHIYSVQAVPIGERSNCLCLIYRKPRHSVDIYSQPDEYSSEAGHQVGDEFVDWYASSDGSSSESDDDEVVPATVDSEIVGEKISFEIDQVFFNPGSRREMEDWINQIAGSLAEGGTSLLSWHPLPGFTENASLSYVARPGFVSFTGSITVENLDFKWWSEAIAGVDSVFIYGAIKSEDHTKRPNLFQLPSTLSGINEEAVDDVSDHKKDLPAMQLKNNTNDYQERLKNEMIDGAGPLLSSYLYKRKRVFHAFNSGNSTKESSARISVSPRVVLANVTEGATGYSPKSRFSLPRKIKSSDNIWSARWCVLRPSQLLWYSDQNEYEVLEIIDLKDIIMVIAAPEEPFSFPNPTVLPRTALKTRVLKWIQRRREQKQSSAATSESLTVPEEDCHCDWCKFGRSLTGISSDQARIDLIFPSDSREKASAALYWSLVSLWHDRLISIPSEILIKKSADTFSRGPADSTFLDQLRTDSNPLLDPLLALAANREPIHNVKSCGNESESPTKRDALPPVSERLNLYPLQIITAKKRYYFAVYDYEILQEWMRLLRKSFIQNKNQ